MVNICPEKEQNLDILYTKYWAAAISALIGICVLLHWMQVMMRHMFSTTSIQIQMAKYHKPLTRISRGFVFWKTVLLPSRFLLAMAYIAINLVIMFTNLDWSLPNIEQVYGMRCGWLAACNLILTIFLGLKNTILSPIAGKSYDSINILHRACGYTTILCMILHSTNMVGYLFRKHETKYLNLPGQYAAAVAGFSMLTIAITAFHPIRKRFYELFYVVHIVLVMTILIVLYIHLSQINWAAKTFPIVGAVIWGADRLIRWTKWLYFSYGNNCTLVALPEGATKVIMKRKIIGRPGSHAFLAIPHVRRFQSHPFTLAANDPATFVIAAHSGFTKALHRLAKKSPNRTFRAGVEGSYGAVPAVNSYDRAVLVGGGSGATFTIALAMDWLSKQSGKEGGPVHSLSFIWAIKHEDYLVWFEKELVALNNSPHVDVKIYITRGGAAPDPVVTPPDTTSVSRTPSAPNSDEVTLAQSLERPELTSGNSSESTLSTGQSISLELKKGTQHSISYGRPDVGKVIEAAIMDLGRTQRVLVAGSGPPGLLHDTRRAAKAATRIDAPFIELHLEEFDW